MNTLKITTKEPVKFSVKKGERYSFCTCGFSTKMPLCDGSHREKAQGKRSHKFEAEKNGDIWLCMCENDEDTKDNVNCS